LHDDLLIPWRNGYYKAETFKFWLFYVKGTECTIEWVCGKPSNITSYFKGNLKLGRFKVAHPDVVMETAKFNYNVEITLFDETIKIYAVVNDEGSKFTFYACDNELDSFELQSEQEISSFRESGDPAEAPPNRYKIQPEKKGKLVFISGVPGSGKSTSGHLLSKKNGFVYYEADAFMFHLNPYVLAFADHHTRKAPKNFLKGVSQRRIDAVAECGNAITGEFKYLLEGEQFDFNKVATFYSAMCKDILKEKKRMRGDWVVVHAVPTRELRDHIRKELDDDVTFLVLNMSRKDQVTRIKERQGFRESSMEMFLNAYNSYEPAQDDEPKTIDLLVTNSMNPDDVAYKIIATLN
jgi:gluconate kinase